MPKVTVIMPVYNVEKFVAAAIQSVLGQRFQDFELLIIDDCSPDSSQRICRQFSDPRIRIIQHTENRGLASARNTGIRQAQGEILAFIDSDDCWLPEKLQRHVAHLNQKPEVGVSFSRSAFIEENGQPNHCYQMPKLINIKSGYLLCRNPIGNGSSPVIRREVFENICFDARYKGERENCYFDEQLRRSEDIECWIRIALTTSWKIEGIPKALTLYRLNEGGLSASLIAQYNSWQQVIEQTRAYAPEFIARWERPARAFQLRYLARQAIRLHDGNMSVHFAHMAIATDWSIAFKEPGRTLSTLAASYILWLSPNYLYPRLEKIAITAIGRIQARRINRDIA